MELKKKRILIAGGYGLVGGNVARLIRKRYQDVELILAGRTPQHGEQLARELGNAKTAYLDLKAGFNAEQYGAINLVIAATEDRSNILQEAAILNGFACITITEMAEDISPVVCRSLYKAFPAPIVLASHWQAGIITLIAKQISTKFSEITRVETAGLYDERDPVGPMVAEQVKKFVGNALLRSQGEWKFVDAKENARDIHLYNGTQATGYPMGTLDVPSLAAITGSPNVRFDFATGVSIGTHKGISASHDLYIDMEGVLTTGENSKLRTIVSDPKGYGHLTAVSIFLITEKILGLGDHPGIPAGGLYLPETILLSDEITTRIEEFGIDVIIQAL
ncbi:hypothetical protein LJ707_09380 [Mucilaginibacter sp. UR6-1]|uniref:hypothetical protein n=1 Tax=Mucilaginibacter sp. UR6-1 TaxID=1435643 RepID=UPI001E497306|nr:hypothetical protein [Mucilaginibacter sp. UR6-1]MCC8409142.1 hypothetical protein [Mucilaginibacter sp. UR6-1]